MLDGGVDEDLARASLQIGTGRDLANQYEKLATMPYAYILSRNSEGRIKGVLKYTGWTKVDEANYAANPIDALIRKVDRKVCGRQFVPPKLGFQALYSANDGDEVVQEQRSTRLIKAMLAGRRPHEMGRQIVVPLHEHDSGRVPALINGFQPTSKKSRTTDLKVGEDIVTVPLAQRLYVRQPERDSQ